MAVNRSGEWEIKSRSETCADTGRAFFEDESFHTLLFQEKEGLRRVDLCDAAWQARKSSTLSPAPISQWSSRFKPSAPQSVEAVGKQDAESELRRLLEQNAPETAKVCRLLALLLERKRILKLRERLAGGEGGSRLLVYEHSDTQESFIVPDVDFKLADLDALRDEIMNHSGSRVFSVSGVTSAENPSEPVASSTEE